MDLPGEVMLTEIIGTPMDGRYAQLNHSLDGAFGGGIL
jgi:hypothetical protein